MMKTIHVVQVFEISRKRLVPTAKLEARDEAHARLRAERTVESKPGAAVLAISLDTETGEVDTTRIVARFGETPDDLDQLIGG
jgi:hypothetical protein